MTAMAVIYANQIIRLGQHPTNPYTIDDVHPTMKEAVLANLASRGYDGYGLPFNP